ncbi:MAG TPA: oxidative damage protection protein [Thermoanaerobaculaceae bacterium]|nr:oxidative damage protection protein [Thermoanaerobaculaceae bacterium]
MPVTCKRCGQTGDALAQPPIPSALGAEIQASICQACWREWLRTQVILINEYRLNLMDPQARQVLEGQMLSFLNLSPGKPA